MREGGRLSEQLLCELGYNQGRVRILCDSKAAIDFINNPMASTKLKHISIASKYIKELDQQLEVKVTKIATEDNPADILTKPLGRQFHEKHATAIMHA